MPDQHFIHSRRAKPGVTARSTTTGKPRQPVARRRTSRTATLTRQALASVAAGLLLVAYALPAYAELDPSTPEQAFSAGGTSQEFSADLVGSSQATSRDSYAITPKPKPKSVIVRMPAYGGAKRGSGTFASDPANLLIQWPLADGTPISSWFGPRASPCSGCSSFHEGLDINPGAGIPIAAIADGVVAKVGNPSGSYGVYAVIDHVIDGQKVSSLYGHMQLGSLAMAVGQQVKKGQLVGKVGSTGASSGPHLHLSIFLEGVPIDPYAYMRAKIGS